MFRTVLIAILVVAVAGVAYWGYEEHQDKNAILIHAENNYQQAFHDLTYHIDQLQDKIGAVLAMNSADSLSPALAQVWKISSMARSEVSQLPLALMPFNNTEEFLAKVGTFSYRTSIRDLEKKPLTKEEYQQLEALYKRSTEIERQLRKVQALVMKNNLRWMDVEMALATDEEPRDNTIIDGFKTVEANMDGNQLNWGPEINRLTEGERHRFQDLPGKKISADEARNVAKKFLDLQGEQEIKVTETGKGANYDAYSLTFKHPKTGATVTMDVTKKGGHPLWMIKHRKIGKAKIGLNKAMEIAQRFLKEHAFDQMEMATSQQYGNTGVFTFVRVENGVRIYPDSIRIKVGLDQGDIIAYDATEYLAFHQERNIPKPKLSVEEAKEKVNGHVKIRISRKALIQNELGEEVLCYEFLGTIGTDTYRIFINAMDGSEEKVNKLQEARAIYR